MKNGILFLLLLSLTITSADAQSEFRVGGKAGVNFSTFGGVSSNDSYRANYHIGGLVEIPLLNRLSLQTELLYSGQGSRDDERPTDGSLRVSKLDYLLLPVLPKFYFSDSFSLLAGPQLGYLLSAKQETKGSGFITGNTTTIESDIKDDLNNLEIGLNFGAEYRLPFGIFFQMRYYFGLTNINEADTIETTTLSIDNSSYNNVYQVSVGFSF